MIAGAGFFLTACDRTRAGSQDTSQTLFTCGMHPQVVQDHPGNCPICGMKLTPIRKEASAVKGSAAASTAERDRAPTSESAVIAVDPVTMQNMGIRTAVLTRGPLRRLIRTVGVIDYDETALSDVTTKFKGWVEKLYVNATGQLVMRGEPLFDIYSPELYTAQREYLLALDHATNSPGQDSLKTSALTKLKFFDISDEQIAELQRTREPSKTLRIVAPQDGFVMEKSVVKGQMVDAGMRTYRLADLGLVWVQAQIYEQDLAYIRLGQEVTVTLSYLPDREFRGRVTYIYPNLDEKTRTAKVRMEFHNPGYFLKPGMFATVHVISELEPSVLLVPDMAVLRSGEKNTVFVALDEGKFEPRSVVLGLQAENDMYQVVSGLKDGERVVTSGQFMLDSESQLREAIQKMMEPRQAGPGTETNDIFVPQPSPEVTSTSSTNAETGVKYICPMPEHVSIEYDHPGKCPICGMTLVPVTQAALAKLQPGGKLLYYTCPMPEHSDVRSDKPGKCPKCGMTLIPVMAVPPISSAAKNP
jgi:RND family efflux transporter MFP subunit